LLCSYLVAAGCRLVVKWQSLHCQEWLYSSLQTHREPAAAAVVMTRSMTIPCPLHIDTHAAHLRLLTSLLTCIVSFSSDTQACSS